MANMMRFKDFWVKKTLVGLGLGQFLSLLITSTGFSSSELAKKGINVPTSQSFLNYVLLAIVYGGIMLYRRKPLKHVVKRQTWRITAIMMTYKGHLLDPGTVTLGGSVKLVIFGLYMCS
ncbi:hypothetical protein ACFX1X_032173 [Malus domestica]